MEAGLHPPVGARDALEALARPGAVLFVLHGGRAACVTSLPGSEVELRLRPELVDWLVFAGAVGLAARGRRGRRYTLSRRGCAIGREMGLWAS